MPENSPSLPVVRFSPSTRHLSITLKTGLKSDLHLENMCKKCLNMGPVAQLQSPQILCHRWDPRVSVSPLSKNKVCSSVQSSQRRRFLSDFLTLVCPTATLHVGIVQLAGISIWHTGCIIWGHGKHER